MPDHHRLSTVPLHQRLSIALNSAGFRGDVTGDFAARAAFSTDNSVYQIVPDIVVAPRDTNDTVVLLKTLEKPEFSGLAITGRGGGTGTNGQSLNSGVIVDFRRYMNRILDIDTEEGWIDVEPGIVLDDLNEQIASTGLFFAPNTSTSNRCTVGGMASTDASGKGSRIYGKTADNIVGLEVCLAGGKILDSRTQPPDWAREMLTDITDACDAGRAPLLRRIPKLSRRFSGLDIERARPNGDTLEWWRLFIGAEGSLGLITRLRLKLTPRPKTTRLGIIAFESFLDALDATVPLLDFEPLAIEVMDEWVQSLARKAGLLDALPPEIRSEQTSVYMFIEFVGDDAQAIEQKLGESLVFASRQRGYCGSHMESDSAQIAHLWSVRAAAVGLLGASSDHRRPIAFVEDCVVPPEYLAAFVKDFTAILGEHGVPYGIYGHADVGCLHVRPALDLDAEKDRERFKTISDTVFETVTRHGGIFWGEHGKGIRGDYLEAFVGPEAFAAFERIKLAFDPARRFNPGKLVAEKAARYTIEGTPLRRMHGRDANDPLNKAFACNGNALCLNYAVRTPMCPSFKVSADLRHSPKGRAEALRGLEQARDAGIATNEMEEAVFETLDHCLGCKSCAGTCPAHVDIPQMRSHFLEHYYRSRRRPLADYCILNLEKFSGMLGRFQPALRMLSATALYRWIGSWLGFVDLPWFSISSSYAGIPVTRADNIAEITRERTVLLVQDPFTALFDTQAINDIARGLQALGYEPLLLELIPGGKAAHVKGDIREFRRQAELLRDTLNTAAASGLPLIGVDPSLVYMLRSEYPASNIGPVAKVMAIEEFLLSEFDKGRLATRALEDTPPVSVFLHCTEKSMRPTTPSDWSRVMDRLGIPVVVERTGCCGMSGVFGHEKRHLDWSRRLFDLSWSKPLKSATAAYATGFSCRCQTKRFGDKLARHPMHAIARALKEPDTD